MSILDFSTCFTFSLLIIYLSNKNTIKSEINIQTHIRYERVRCYASNNQCINYYLIILRNLRYISEI